MKIWYSSMTYYYQFFMHYEVSESVLHGVKLMKCYIFGLTKPTPSDNVTVKVQAGLCISTVLSEPSNSGNIIFLYILNSIYEGYNLN